MDQPNRIFFPYHYFGNTPYLVGSGPSSGVQRLGDDTRTMVIDIHGAISKNVAAYGLYFGEGCLHNEGALLPGPEYRNQAAELYSVLTALNAVREFSLGTDLLTVVLRTDSSYLPKHLNEMVWIWERKDWKNGKGNPVAHADLLLQVHDAFLYLENNNIEVQLWEITKDENKNAVEIARNVFVQSAAQYTDDLDGENTHLELGGLRDLD